MERKSLFDGEELGGPEAANLNSEFSAAVYPIFKKYYDMGFKAREIGLLMSSNIALMESAIILKNIKRKRLDVDKPEPL